MIELLSEFLIILKPGYTYSLDIIDNYGPLMNPNTVGFILTETWNDKATRFESGFVSTTFDKITSSDESN